MKKKIFGRWKEYSDIAVSFNEGPYDYEKGEYTKGAQKLLNFPAKEELLFASYGGGEYDGDAFVLFRKDNKLWEVNASHCSCYGLSESNYSGEGGTQWKPEETSVAALQMKQKQTENSYDFFLSDHEAEAVEEYWEIVSSLT